MAFEISEYAKPVEPVAIEHGNAGRIRSPFTIKMQGLPVGKAFFVTGMTPANAGSRVNQFKIRNPGTSFKVDNLRDGRVQITRLS